MSYPMLPVGLPACALRDGWQMSPVMPLRRTEMDDGVVASSRKLSRLPVRHMLTWELSAAQLDLVQYFWAEDLDAGNLWFLCPMVEGQRIGLHRVRFAGDPPWTITSPSNGVFHFGFEAELRDLPRLTLAEKAAVEVWLALNGDQSTIDRIIAANTALAAVMP